MTADNPYAAPTTEPEPLEPESTEPETLGAIAKATFLAWEKLRLVYVAVLGLFTLIVGLPLLSSFSFWLTVVAGALFANACFFSGPIVESYVKWLGFRAAWLRWLLFVLGTVFASLLTIVTVATMLLPIP